MKSNLFDKRKGLRAAGQVELWNICVIVLTAK